MGNKPKVFDVQKAISFKAGYVVFVSPMYRSGYLYDGYSRLKRKGYFKDVTRRERRKGGSYGNYFERTDKAWVEGDSLKKPIAYSN